MAINITNMFNAMNCTFTNDENDKSYVTTVNNQKKKSLPLWSLDSNGKRQTINRVSKIYSMKDGDECYGQKLSARKEGRGPVWG